MIIADSFVFIHVPKTGGTFVETVMREIHKKRNDLIMQYRYNKSDTLNNKRLLHGSKWQQLKNKLTGDIDLIYHWKQGVNQHGSVRSIPQEHKNKPILTCIRNPYDHYVSMYEFKWWRQSHPWQDFDFVKETHPNYPNITFAEFLELQHTQRPNFINIDPEIRSLVGFRSSQLLEYIFTSEYRDNLKKYKYDYVSSGQARKDMPSNVIFLRTNNLNQDLYEALLNYGYPQNEIEFILERGKIMPPQGGRSKEQKWEKYYTPELKQRVRDRDWIIFELFPEFDQ